MSVSVLDRDSILDSSPGSFLYATQKARYVTMWLEPVDDDTVTFFCELETDYDHSVTVYSCELPADTYYVIKEHSVSPSFAPGAVPLSTEPLYWDLQPLSSFWDYRFHVINSSYYNEMISCEKLTLRLFNARTGELIATKTSYHLCPLYPDEFTVYHYVSSSGTEYIYFRYWGTALHDAVLSVLSRSDLIGFSRNSSATYDGLDLVSTIDISTGLVPRVPYTEFIVEDGYLDIYAVFMYDYPFDISFSLSDVSGGSVLPAMTLTGSFADATITFSSDSVSIYYEDIASGYATVTFPCDLSESFCITSSNTTDFRQMNVVQYEHEYGTALPLMEFLDENNNINLYTYSYTAERTFQLSTSTGRPIVDPVELYGWFEDGTVSFDSFAVYVTYFDPIQNQDVTVGWTLGDMELYAVSTNYAEKYSDLNIVQYAENLGDPIPIGTFYNDRGEQIFYLVFTVDYDDYFEDTSGRRLIPLNSPDGDSQSALISADVFVDGSLASGGGGHSTPYENTSTLTTALSVLSFGGSVLEPQLDFVLQMPDDLTDYYIASARYAIYYPKSMAVDFQTTGQTPDLFGRVSSVYYTTDENGVPIDITDVQEFSNSDITVSKYWTTPTYDRTNGVFYIDFTLLCTLPQITVVGTPTQLVLSLCPAQVVTSLDTADRGGVKIQLVSAWFGTETAQYRANSVVNKIAQDFARRQSQSEALLNVMETVNYPDAAEVQELATMADPFTVVSPDDFAATTEHFAAITGSRLIENIMLISMMFALISYVLFGKKDPT